MEIFYAICFFVFLLVLIGKKQKEKEDRELQQRVEAAKKAQVQKEINRLNQEYEVLLTQYAELIEQTKVKYYLALQGKDKAEALRLGREYYRLKKWPDEQITAYEEAAIANDINTMKV